MNSLELNKSLSTMNGLKIDKSLGDVIDCADQMSDFCDAIRVVAWAMYNVACVSYYIWPADGIFAETAVTSSRPLFFVDLADVIAARDANQQLER